ncbi:hypothetical protein FGRMN_3461 [Fusarium graminum]|nr:hypothetical protein FGRMN_3461 [Fusarium graminum]
MTRPSIVRADHHAPSAQDHTKSPRLGGTANSLGPHQAETIREVSHDTADEQRRSPRVSLDNRNSLDEIDSFADELVANNSGLSSRAQGTRGNNDSTMIQDDALAAAQNGGASSSDEGELDGDDDLDDDMMDKISSSPSIEDGGCYPVTAPMAWPRRVSSLPSSQWSSSPSISGSSGTRVCSPYPESHTCMPSPSAVAQLPRTLPTTIQDHRFQGEYTDRDDNDAEADAEDSWATFDSTEEFHEAYEEETQTTETDLSDSTDEDNTPDYDPLLTIPYEESFEDDDSDLSIPDDPNFIDSGWAIECLQDIEDIDFEFVYALHTFVATVEGQANATKGDTMVLLDDSNSYWWLVRVVKDSSIGYLPAEHIETPTERLARLNKHRNVDLSATMLGDTAEKKAQTFKSPIRFGRKTVTFTSPTYHDYTEVDDYSTDEEDLDELFATSSTNAKQDKQETKKDTRDPAATISIIEDDSSEESARVEPLKPRSAKDIKKSMEPSKVETVEEEDETQDSDDMLFDSKAEGPSRSRNGTVRNTDSFFRDETVETKKITLTPNLLRDDNQPRPSQDSTKDAKSRGSMDRLDKELMSDKEKKKSQDKTRKEKEKKPSAIRSFFSRKDRKKSVDEDDESFGKRSMDLTSEPRDSESIEEIASPQRSISKLQKPMARTETSPGKGGQGETSSAMELAAYFAESRVNDVSNVPPASMRIVNPETQETHEVPSNSQSGGDLSRTRSSSATARHDDTKALAKALGRSASTGGESRKVKGGKPRQLMDVDELSSSDEDIVSQSTPRATTEETSGKKIEAGLRPQLPGAFPDSFDASGKQNGPTAQRDRLSESPVEVSPVNATRPPALEIDTSSQEGRSSSEVPSPELMPGDETPKDSSSTRSAKEPGWDDEKLRAFFDDGEHVRDLLMVVYDKTDVEPVGKDHPVQLDNMLGDWLARKQRLRGSL